MILKKTILVLAAICTAAALLPVSAAEPVPDQAKLIEVLKSSAGRKEKADACRELARVGGAEAVPALAALLPDPELSHMARYGLETIPGSAVDKAFRDALTKLDGQLLTGVIGSVGVRRDTAAVPQLVKFLGHADAEVSSAAARSLGKIGNQDAARALRAALPSTETARQPALCEALFRCAERLSAVGDRQEAIDIYDQLAGVSTLPQVRAGGWRGAVLSRGADGLPLLAKALESKDPAIFGAALRVAQEMPEPAVTKVLLAALRPLNADGKIQVLQTLGERRDKAALQALYAEASTGDQAVRIAALRAVSQISDSSSAPALARWMSDPDAAIASQAREAFSALPGKEADGLVLAMLNGPEASRRIMGLDLAERRRMATALPQILRLTSDADANVRTAAIRKLGVFSKPGDPAALLEILGRAQPGDLEATEQALGTLGSRTPDRDAYAQTLSGKMAGASPAQRCVLVRAIGGMGTPIAFGLVKNAVADPEPEVRAAAIRSFVAWDKPEAAPELLELARKIDAPADKTLCLRSYIALTGNGDIPVPQKLAMCKEAGTLVAKPDEKKLLLGALGNIPSPEAVVMIQPYLADAAVRDEAATAAVNACDKILQQKISAEAAAQITPALEQVSAGQNSALAEKAKKLLEKTK